MAIDGHYEQYFAPQNEVVSTIERVAVFYFVLQTRKMCPLFSKISFSL